MAEKIKQNKIRILRSSVAGRVPSADSLEYGQLAINFKDGKLFYKDAEGGVSHFLSAENQKEVPAQSVVVTTTEVPSAGDTITYNLPILVPTTDADGNQTIAQLPNNAMTVTMESSVDEEGNTITTTTMSVPVLNLDELWVKRLHVSELAELPETVKFTEIVEDGETVVVI